MVSAQRLSAPDLSRAVDVPPHCALESLITTTRWARHHARMAQIRRIRGMRGGNRCVRRDFRPTVRLHLTGLGTDQVEAYPGAADRTHGSNPARLNLGQKSSAARRDFRPTIFLRPFSPHRGTICYPRCLAVSLQNLSNSIYEYRQFLES